jgi:hypothetical protein
VFEECPDLPRGVLADVMEDAALVRAIEQGETSALSREEVVGVLEGGT